jgi:hypothetical protein
MPRRRRREGVDPAAAREGGPSWIRTSDLILIRDAL